MGLGKTGFAANAPPASKTKRDVAMTPPPYGEPINLETAKKAAAPAIAETTKRNWNAFCVSVVNPSGYLVYPRSRIIANMRPSASRSTRHTPLLAVVVQRWYSKR
jgi:hypothetical protein